MSSTNSNELAKSSTSLQQHNDSNSTSKRSFRISNKRRNWNEAASSVILYDMSSHGLQPSKITEKHGKPSNISIVTKCRRPTKKRRITKTKTKESDSEDSDANMENDKEYYFEIDYKDADSELYSWWDGLYEFGELCFQVLLQSNEPELKQLVQDCYASNKWVCLCCIFYS